MNIKLIKLGHACVLAEADGTSVLFDPGVWSDELNIDDVASLDQIVITHLHPDHMDMKKIAALIERFPEVKMVCDGAVAAKLKEEGITIPTVESTDETTSFEAPHDVNMPILGAPIPPNTGYHFAKALSHPGDNNSPPETMPILAMPFTAPWANPRDGVDACVRLKPKYVIAIHDWHLSDAGRSWYDTAFTNSLAQHDIEFITLNHGDSVELEV